MWGLLAFLKKGQFVTDPFFFRVIYYCFSVQTSSGNILLNKASRKSERLLSQVYDPYHCCDYNPCTINMKLLASVGWVATEENNDGVFGGKKNRICWWKEQRRCSTLETNAADGEDVSRTRTCAVFVKPAIWTTLQGSTYLVFII